MNKALINIDYTVDFVDTNGKLTCGKPGQDIEKEIVKVTKDFLKDQSYVVFAIDLHKENDQMHPEFNLFPPHNLEGTKGRFLFGELHELYQEHKDSSLTYWLDKTRYSAFAGTDLEMKLRERKITEIHLIGVCTDICILHTAIDAYNKGFKIVIHQHAVASFNAEGHKWALGHFKNSLGATLV